MCRSNTLEYYFEKFANNISKSMNFTDFYSKLFYILYDYNFTLNLVKKMTYHYCKNTVNLPDQNLTVFLHL